jgi:hypothetical protein
MSHNLTVRVFRRNVGHLQSDLSKDFEIDTVKGLMPDAMNTATAQAKQQSRKDTSSYYGTEVWHTTLETWVHRTLYYKGYEISARGSL